MTELQIGLAGLGIVAVFGVVVYNTWQEYRHRKLAQQMLKQPQEDALLGASSVAAPEPVWHDEDSEPVLEPEIRPTLPETPPFVAMENDAPPLAPDMRIEPVLHLPPEKEALVPAEPVFTEAPASPPPMSAPPPAPEAIPTVVPGVVRVAEPRHLLSPDIDYIASIESVEPTLGSLLLESQRENLARIRKPVLWVGFNEATREWESIVDDGRREYRSLRIGLQLVDRRGAVADNDLALFHLAMNELADELMAIVDMPQRQAVLDAAAKLDAFCADVDIQIGINLINEGQLFPGTKIRALAEAAGMTIDAEGRFVRCDDEGRVLYLLLNQEASGFSAETMKTMSTHGMTFLLDVPRVAHGERVFGQMIEQARKFAEVLHGAMVDDNRRLLSDVSLEPIRRQIGQYQEAMSNHQIPAGSPQALRLFS